MSATCINCGTEFQSKLKGFKRKSIQQKLKCVDKTIKDVLEEEYNVVLSPWQKETRFLCPKCSVSITSIAKTKKKLHETASASSYLKRKILSGASASVVSKKCFTPLATPRKVKRRRMFSPSKLQPSTSTKQTATVHSRTSVNMKVASPDVATALRYINRSQYKKGITLLLKARVGFKNAMIDCMRGVVRKEVSDFVQQNNELRGGKTLDEMASFDWNTVYEDVEKACPVLTNVLVGTLTTNSSFKYMGLASKTSSSAKPIVGTVASIIMYNRRRTLSHFQEMNSLQMWLSSAKRELFARFNHLGLCTGIASTRSTIDRIRKNYDNEVYEMKTSVVEYISGLSVTDTSEETILFSASDADMTDVDSDIVMETPKESPTPSIEECGNETDEQTSSAASDHPGRLGYSICFDNVNTKVTVRHQCKDKKNKMFNMVQAYAAKDRIPSLHLSDTQPSPEALRHIPLAVYFPSLMDEVTLRSEMTTMVTRVVAKNLLCFVDVLPQVNQHLHHRYSKESTKKSIIVPLGVMDKDEAKVADTIDIMEEYHQYVPFKPTGEPLTLPLHADGLSCERGNDAQNARMNAADPWMQLQGLRLNAQEWHKRCTLLQDVYDELYGGAGREKGTLLNLKNYFNHRNVSTNVKLSFNHNEEFLDFCGDGYITLAACHFLGIEEVSQIPESLPADDDDKMSLLNRVAGQIIDMVFVSCHETVGRIVDNNGNGDEGGDCAYPYCICRMDIGKPMIFCDNRKCHRGQWFHLTCIGMTEDDVPDGKWYCGKDCLPDKKKKNARGRKTVAQTLKDGKQAYVLLTMWRALNQKIRRDAIRENDGERIVLHWKFDMLQFAAEHHPKYFLLGQRLLAALNGSVSPRLRHTLMWNRTVNPTGGKGKNIAMDLQMEFLNKQFKESVKDAAGHLTEATIARHSQMMGVGNVLRDVYARQVSGTAGTFVHKRPDVDRAKDISEFVSLLGREDFFTWHAGRLFLSFEDVDLGVYRRVNVNNIRKRLERHTKEMSSRQEVILMMQANN